MRLAPASVAVDRLFFRQYSCMRTKRARICSGSCCTIQSSQARIGNGGSAPSIGAPCLLDVSVVCTSLPVSVSAPCMSSPASSTGAELQPQVVGAARVRRELIALLQDRSEERRVGKEGVSTCRYRGAPST